MKTLYSKLLITYISIMLVGFIILALVMVGTFEKYFITQKEEDLIRQAKTIHREYLKAYRTGVIDTERLNFEMEALDRYLDARIWFINPKGEIYINSRIENISLIEEELKYDEIKEVFNGDIIKREGYFKGFFDERVLTIGYPITVNDRVIYALFMHTPIPEVKRTISDIYKITLSTLTFSTLIALILIFIMSKNITQEIKELNEGVQVIAKGDFEKRLDIRRKDELGQLAHSFNNMASELNELEDLRRRFISNLSHDLRSPLTSINGFTKAILDGTIPQEQQKKYLEIIENESQRLTKLTNDILDLSKIQSGDLILEKEAFNIHNVLINVLDGFEPRLLEKQVHVDVNFDSPKATVEGDVQQIKRVLYNLVDNAVKFVENRGTLRVATYAHGEKIRVIIGNSGTVLSEEDLRAIWQRFNKLDRSRGKDKAGSGLGLAIVKEIIKAHHETIDVKSNEEIGVEFTFALPKHHGS